MAAGVSSYFLVRDYRALKAQRPHMVELQAENTQQKLQFVYLAQRIDLITQKLDHLKKFDKKLKMMVNLETNTKENEDRKGVGGSNPELLDPKHTLSKSHKDLVRKMHKSLDYLDDEVAVGEKEKTELHQFLENQKVILASTPSIWPTKGWLSSGFGYRISPFTDEREFHRGIDISARMGAPIVAPADGIVSKVYRDYGYGRVVIINHGYGLATKFAHLKTSLVKKGQFVKRGETIALVGNTGRSTAPHLHYEVHLNRVPVNPLRYILN
jgi:murein DD-endopeptidase MepM/ murein hydrolase activator NlpD